MTAAKRGAQVGNQNGAKGKQYFDALRAELATLEDKKRNVKIGQALRMVAREQIFAALDGDTTAIRDIADRLDGKPHQSVDATIDGNLTVNIKRFS